MTSRANNSRLSQMCSWVFLPAWFRRITESICEVSNLRSFWRSVSGEPITPPASARRGAHQPAGQRPAVRLGVGALPLLVLVPQIDRARRRPLAHRALAVEAQ